MTRTSRRSVALRVAGLVGASALVFAACSGSGSTPTGAPTQAPASGTPGATPGADTYQVTLAQDPKLGPYLAGMDGRALYLFTKDSANTATCAGQCAAAWPPFELEASETISAAAGVTGTLATVKRDDGAMQVTYNGIPLYYFGKDTKAGDTNGQGLNGVWFLVAPASTSQGGPITGGVGQGGSPGGEASPSAGAGGGSTAARIANFAFAPASMTVKAGSTVTWTNGDAASHTVTADDGSFDSGSISSGATYQQTFATAGTFAYHCAIHRSMTATITVTP